MGTRRQITSFQRQTPCAGCLVITWLIKNSSIFSFIVFFLILDLILYLHIYIFVSKQCVSKWLVNIVCDINKMDRVPIVNSLLDFFKSSYEGIDTSLEGNGGIECYDYLTLQTRILDTCVFTALVFVFILPRVLRTISLPKEWEIISYCRKRTAQRICGFRKVLLVVLSIVLGVEIGYKIADRSWIFLLNPCHVITAIQVCLHFIKFVQCSVIH